MSGKFYKKVKNQYGIPVITDVHEPFNVKHLKK